MSGDDPRLTVLEGARAMDAAGLNPGTAGNTGLRHGEAVWITPTGMAARDLVAEDICLVHPDGRSEGRRKPSSEWRLHTEVLAARLDLHAVIHTHAPFCSALAVHSRGIPQFHYMVALFGGTDVPCAPYATFGEAALAEGVARVMGDRKACLMAHHGMLVAGETMAKAITHATVLEELAEVYWRALQIGDPPLLDDAEMARVVAKFSTYGQQ